MTSAQREAVDIRLRGLTKRYGDFAAVDAVDLDVAEGEFFTLLGPSGSGKTTTLRLIAGFAIPDGGTVELGGRDVTRLPPDARAVNTVSRTTRCSRTCRSATTSSTAPRSPRSRARSAAAAPPRRSSSSASRGMSASPSSTSPTTRRRR